MNGFEKIPQELKQIPNWVLWKKLPDLDKDKKQKLKPDGSPSFRKVPYQINGQKAKANDPATWTTFEKVLEVYRKSNKYAGIGFEFDGSGIFGLDFDGSNEVEQIKNGDFTGDIGKIITRLDSYTEISQSGKGLHIICKGQLPGPDFKTSFIEVYQNKRYFIMTGNVIDGFDGLGEATEEIKTIYDQYNPKSLKSEPEVGGEDSQDTLDDWERGELSGSKLTDDQVIEKASGATNGDKFKDLYYNGPGSDHSASDLALCNMLAFWCGKDPDQMDRLFRGSSLYRSKWDEIHDPANNRTYGQMTIDKAISNTSEVYGAKPKKAPGQEDIPYFEQSNRYWKEVIKRNGEETAVPISNFVLVPKRRINTLEDSEEVTECVAVNINGFSKMVSIAPVDFTTTTRFNEKLQSLEFRFTGSLTDLQYIKTLVTDHEVPSILGTTTNGFHLVGDSLVYVDSSGHIGGVEVKSLADQTVQSDLTTEGAPSCKMLSEIGPHLFRFNELEITCTIIGWTCATFLKDKLKQLDFKFPHLFISGSAGSGKSQTVSTIIQSICGIRSNSINANDITKYAINLTSDANNTSPICIDEYKPGMMAKTKVLLISDFLRNSYDGARSIRGLPSNRGKMEIRELKAPVLIAGEESIEEKANLERTLFVSFTKDGGTPHVSSFMELKSRKNNLRKLGRLLLDESFKISLDRLRDLIRRAEQTPGINEISSSRTKDNVTVCICGLFLLNSAYSKFGQSIKVDEYASWIIKNATREEDENEAGLTVVDEMMNRLGFFVGSHPDLISRERCDPIYIDSKGDLLIRLQDVYDAASKYRKQIGDEQYWLSFSNFKKQLKKEKYFINNRATINTMRTSGQKSGAAWKLDTLEMSLKGIELDGFEHADQRYKNSMEFDYYPQDTS